MLYTVEPTPDGKFAVLNVQTKRPYGDPLDSIEAALGLAREAEAYAVIDRMIACRAGSCSI